MTEGRRHLGASEGPGKAEKLLVLGELALISEGLVTMFLSTLYRAIILFISISLPSSGRQASGKGLSAEISNCKQNSFG